MRNSLDYQMMRVLPEQLLHLRGWHSQDEVSSAIGVRRATVSDWENGKSLPSLGVFFKLLFWLCQNRGLYRSAVENCTVELTLPGGVRCRVQFIEERGNGKS
ncbi:MAG: helix-turn-helix transcriptional regulator [Chloroflexi bacterium]|nr:helix-turn-helix transcriptional regulator [Chloroflexota bacterium]